MSGLLTPIAIERPPAIQFGAGLAPQAGAFARARRRIRPLVIPDPFNARRVDLLDIPGEPVVFGTVRP